MKSGTRRYYESLVARAVADVRMSVNRALDLHSLAKRAALSPLHFHRIFRGLLGETPLEMHRRLRLERAAAVLAGGDDPVTQIAFETGYETHESFTRAFREVFAVSPSEFRAAARAQSTPWTASTKGTLAAASGIHYVSPSDMEPTFPFTQELTMKVDVINMPAKRVLAVAHRGPYNAVSESFAKLDAIVRPSGLLARDGLELVAIFHDDLEVTPAAELRAEAGLVVPQEVPILDGLHECTIPSGLYAQTTHCGPYRTLGDTWSQLMGSWLVQSEYRVGTGPAYERYLNTPMDVAPHELQTLLYLPVVSSQSQ